MRGLLKDCFEISGRGTVALLDPDEGSCVIGDWVKIGGEAWQISGIEMPNYRKLPPQEVLKLCGALLTNATKAQLAPLIGQSFETLKHRP